MNSLPERRDYWPTIEWRTAEPKDLGMRPDRLFAVDKALRSRYKSINGIVVVRKGYIAFERYNNSFGPDDTHHVTSVTKSILSALIGIAIDAGYIKRVDQPVLDFFPEYIPGDNDLQKRTLTIRHLLTMTAPFAWQSGVRSEPLDRLRRQRDWVQFILNLLGQNGRPGTFQYNSIGAHLLSAIITRTTGICAREFANQYLFRPLGMREIPDYPMKSYTTDEVFGKNVAGWIKDPGGNTAGGWGLTTTPRDMARFGWLYLNHGIWDNRQLISKKWIGASIAPNSNEYGYLWWLRGKGNSFTFYAAGHGGNHIYCIPGKDLVVAIASKLAGRPHDRWLLLEECIIPAIID